MAARAVGKGVYVPQVSSWKLAYTDASGSEFRVFDSKSGTEGPGGIVSISFDLDGLGLLSSASIQTGTPPDLEPFSHGAKFTIRYKDEAGGEYEEVVWEGLFENFSTEDTTNGRGGMYILQFSGLQKVIEKAYWYNFVTTFPPTIPDLNITDVNNMLGIPVPDIGKILAPYDPGFRKVNKLVKVSEVMEKALESFPNATWGVDGERRMLLGRPEDGDPVAIDAKSVIGLIPTSYEIPPYITESRSDSGTGWAAYGQSRSTGAFVPRVAQDANSTNNESVTTTQGPFWKAARVTPEGHYIVKIDATFDDAGTLTYYPEAEVRDGFNGEDFHDNPSTPGSVISDIVLGDLPKDIDSQLKADMVYIVADPQLWYEGSSLFEDSESNYEPIQAAFQIDLTPLRIPQRQCGSYTGTNNTWRLTYEITEWISQNPTYDLAAVGKAGTPVYKTLASKVVGADPYDPYGGSGTTVNFNQLDGYEGVDSPTCVYPLQSSDSIIVFPSRGKDIDITYSQSQTPYSALIEIDQKWFKEDQRQILIDNGWTGRFYYHAVVAYTVTMPGDTTGGVYPAYQDPGHPDYPNAGRAKVKFTLKQPFFSQKERRAPLFNEDLLGYDYPFFTGPNYEGWLKGVLIPPSKISGEFYQSTNEPQGSDGKRKGKVSIDQYVAGVSVTMDMRNAQTKLRTNVLPYKRFNPYTYNRRYN